jgi:ABC-type uncharacterized transport system substrate-binding protein
MPAGLEATGGLSAILNGAKPADLRVVKSTRFDLISNLQTAKFLGLDVNSPACPARMAVNHETNRS